MIRRSLLALGVVLLHALLVGGAVFASVPVRGEAPQPGMSPDRSAARPGESVFVTLTDWPGRAVTLTVCGNQALRGSQDCDMVHSETESISRDGSSTVAELRVYAPALPCPCVIRGTTRSNEAVAYVPFEVIGHPTGPLIEPEGFDPLGVQVRLRPAHMGLVTRLRSALGGPTPYDVTVTLQNRSGGVVPAVAISGALGRGKGSDNAGIEFPAVGDLAAGQVWEKTAKVTVPAPAVGRFVVTATASGPGPTAQASDAVKRVPILLVVVIAIFVGDMTAIYMRRHAKRRDEEEQSDDEVGLDELVGPGVGASAGV